MMTHKPRLHSNHFRGRRDPIVAAVRLAGVALCGLAGFAGAAGPVGAQGFLVPQTQPVEYRGEISAMNPQTRIITIETKNGSVFALTHPTRRTSDRQVIGGIPPVRVRMTAYESPRALQRGMFIQFRAKLGPRNVVLEPVSDIRILGRLPANGFMTDGGVPVGEDPDGAGPDRPVPDVNVGPGGDLGPEMEIIEDLKGRLPPELRDRIDAGPLDLGIPGADGRGDVMADDGDLADGAAGAADDGVAGDGPGDEGPDDDGPDDDDPAGDDAALDDVAGGDDPEGGDGGGLGLAQWMLVSGQISSPGRRQISVLVPVDGRKQRVRFDLADDAIVLFESDDLSLAAIGDPIRAVGEAVELPRFFATELTVTHVSEELEEPALARLDDEGRLIDGGAGGDDLAPADMVGDRGGADGRDGIPVDPFEIVKREREARENADDDDEEAAAPVGKAGSVFHGRIIKIN